MQKIITLFKRNDEAKNLVRNEVADGAEWVINGEGIATRKYDGTCCAFWNGRFYKRIEWDIKKGQAPPSWLHWDFNPLQRSGHGWLPISDDPADWMHREGFLRGADDKGNPFSDGTYELCGPKLQKNPEQFSSYVLVPHGRDKLLDCPRTFNEIKEYLRDKDIEGVVWHHPDGRMVKIKKKDFGLKR